MKKSILVTLTIVLAFFVGVSTFGQSSVGKLAGRVVDANTKEPLIGANIIILNTELGAATNIDGEYFILNVSPGTYTIKVSYVGYGSKEIQDIRIVPSITYELNAELNSGIELTEIVVTDKKLFEEKATNTVRIIDSDQISRIPVQGVEHLVSFQSGVVVSDGGGVGGNATLNVRGGRGQEVLYVIDGVPQNSSLWNQNFSQVSNGAIDQISFQVGGFEAKYGQAQSGIVNVTTKSGQPNYSINGDAITSSFTDDYGYNLYSLNFGGPIIPGDNGNTFFLSAERGWFLDGNPSAVGVNFPSIGYSSKIRPGASEGLWRLTAKTYHDLGAQFTLRLGGNANFREFHNFSYYGAKNNSEHNPLVKRDNISLNAKLSQNVGPSSFWDLTVGFKQYKQEEGDGVFFDNVEAYGDTLYNPYLTSQGDASGYARDKVGIFEAYGNVGSNPESAVIQDYYRKIDEMAFTGDFSFTSQLSDHLIEAGGGLTLDRIKYFSFTPSTLARNNREYITATGDTVAAKSVLERYRLEKPNYYGYDVMGGEGSDDYVDPQKPVIIYGYLQDRFELEDLVLNLGLRIDYVDTKAKKLKDASLPYGGGTNTELFDEGDYVTADPETYFSPRIGLGFPVTSSTVFHAQYGKFIQQPRLIDVFPFANRLDFLRQTADFTTNNGYLSSEVTTQYEVGFRQILGNNAAALNITAFYKNTKGLTNDQVQSFQRVVDGQTLRYFVPSNSDFGTVKGLALTLDVPRVSYFALQVNYTYSIAEGTGSSSGGAFVAAFRNEANEVPKVIAPLDFDQRHTGIVNLDFYVPKGELGLLERTGLNVVFSFHSGFPYTPLETQNLLVGSTNWGKTTGYVNSTFGPGSFQIDLKLEKSFDFGSASITPYLWIENLLDAKNVVNVWRSTGSPSTTNFLNTESGQKLAAQNGKAWEEDYKSLENDPANYGIPRLIKLGLKVNFAGF